MRSWLDIPKDSDFSIYNIPFGMVEIPGKKPRAATRLGDKVIDLYELVLSGLLTVPGLVAESLHQSTLNDFIGLGKNVTSKVRERIQELFTEGKNEIPSHPLLAKELIFDINEVNVLMPVAIGDYTDFYSSIYHATNVGKMFRPDNPLLPNWKNLPVAYHGRASSIVISGEPVKRPKGQIKPADSEFPVFGYTRMLDFELEMAFILNSTTKLGEPISVEEAEEHIFGFVLFNDWSARDIQSWEYQPLGPFLSKNFISTISPWIVTTEALEPFRVEGVDYGELILPYLRSTGKKNFDVQLEVLLGTTNAHPQRIVSSNYKYMYWNHCQQLAHHTVNGCNVRVGDMLASGTISGPEKEERGCLLELTWRGQDPIILSNGEKRTFLENNDTVIMKGYAQKDAIRVGFGELKSTIIG